MRSIQNTLITLIARNAQVEPDSLTADTLITETGLDSMGVVELIFDIEETFDIALQDTDDIQSRLQLGTIADMTLLLEQAIGENVVH